jgi:hypothetical protein
MISEKTLRKWRKDALKFPTNLETVPTQSGLEMAERVLRLTQELMDLYLVRKG